MLENINLSKLFLLFMKISAIGFGGGYGILPLIREEIVEKRKIINISEFHQAIAKAQSLPGPIAVNTSIFVGLKLFGILGAMVLVAGVVIPPFFSILVIARLIDKFGDIKILQNFLKGARIAIVVVIIDFAVRLSKRNLKRFFDVVSIITGVFLAIILKLPVIWAFLIAATVIYFTSSRESVRADDK